MIKVGKKIASYDVTEIADSEVVHILEDREEDGINAELYAGMDEQKIREQVYQDGDLFANEWDYFKDYLTELMNGKEFWSIKGLNMGWRRLTGHKYLHAKTGAELLNGILPDTDCTLYVYKYKTGLAIKCSHHDAPMGEWYLITPIKEETYKRVGL